MKKLVLISVCILLLGLVALTAIDVKKDIVNREAKIWIERDVFKKDGEVILTVYPDPALTAGKSFGYLFQFTEPFETFDGKELAIYAYHKNLEEKITVVSPKMITDPSTGYSSLERFLVNFQIPIAGLWRYEVFLDREFYADVVFSVKE